LICSAKLRVVGASDQKSGRRRETTGWQLADFWRTRAEMRVIFYQQPMTESEHWFVFCGLSRDSLYGDGAALASDWLTS